MQQRVGYEQVCSGIDSGQASHGTPFSNNSHERLSWETANVVVSTLPNVSSYYRRCRGNRKRTWIVLPSLLSFK